MSQFWQTAGRADRRPAPRQYPEKAVEHACVQLLRLRGYRTYHLAQPRATKQSPGLPDVLAIHPTRGLVLVEVKSPQGRVTPAQRDLARVCATAGVRYAVVHSAAELAAALEAP